MFKPHPFALYAFYTLETELQKVKPTYTLSSFATDPAQLQPSKCPLFVTWNIVKHGEKQLRGCIGTFSPLPIEKGVREYAEIAAFQDTRFRPISSSELPSLSVSITVLDKFEKCKDALDWELGKHGIRVKVYERGRSYGATFLPEVATEQGWTKEETIEHCVRKSGFYGDYELQDVDVERYQGVKCGCTYAEYKEFMKTL